ncbi:FAD-binding protein [Streptomyces yaanensis]|uniref:FAD-binding protein n=1 Tax=Streptomyces yaanensis TaxID=1142239 RepID=A0ABV7S770_9ACTN|nr:FAD-binding protein [Streptomyces sp. CGMCC 4.7035]WNB99666.1 FAD-binding protein [Streptomyces sp. CGMCC 4.7035]
MNGALGTLPAELAGKTVTPDDRRYRMLRSTYTTVGRPAAVVLPESAGDVAAALRLARETGLRVAVRSGGHGLSGSGTNEGGLVIDLSALHKVDVLDRGSRLVRVEAGARWAQVAQTLAPHGLAISSGDHGNVGVGGIATGGGVGWLVRRYGLTVDHIRAVEVVLPDGTFVRADAETEPDLLWVMRGAGAGAGIAVAFEIEAMEVRGVGYAQLVAAVDPAGETLRRWAEVMERAPRELSTAVMLASQGTTTAAFVTAVVSSDRASVIRDAVGPLLGIGDVTAQQAHIVPYTELVPPHHQHTNTGQMPASTTNGLLTGMTPDAARALVTASAAPDPVLIQLRSLGGATHDPAPSATAFAHRHQNTLVIASAFPPDDRATLAAASTPLARHTDGAYVNFESAPDEATFAPPAPASPTCGSATTPTASCAPGRRSDRRPDRSHRPRAPRHPLRATIPLCSLHPVMEIHASGSSTPTADSSRCPPGSRRSPSGPGQTPGSGGSPYTTPQDATHLNRAASGALCGIGQV